MAKTKEKPLVKNNKITPPAFESESEIEDEMLEEDPEPSANSTRLIPKSTASKETQKNLFVPKNLKKKAIHSSQQAFDEPGPSKAPLQVPESRKVTTKSAKANLVFPVARVERHLKTGRYAERIRTSTY